MTARPRAFTVGRVYDDDREYQLRYSAELSRPGAARPPGVADIVRARDVLVVTGTPGTDLEGIDHAELATFPTWDLVKGSTDPPPIKLGRGLVLTNSTAMRPSSFLLPARPVATTSYPSGSSARCTASFARLTLPNSERADGYGIPTA